MPAKLYAIHGSHPSRAVARAMRMKGIDYKVVELLPPTHVLGQRLRFGKRTVPGVRFEDGEKAVGSRAIMRRLEEMVPEPPLFPADPAKRAAVEEAERWGDEVFQGVARRILWASLKAHPRHVPSYQEGSRLPKLPKPLVRVLAPGITRIELRLLNKGTDERVREDLAGLGAQLDRIDAWLADGTLGGADVNAADLQIATSIRLLQTVEDIAAIIDERPCGRWARELFPDHVGRLPAGSIDVPAPAAAAATS